MKRGYMDTLTRENKIILYQTDEGKVKVDVFLPKKTFG